MSTLFPLTRRTLPLLAAALIFSVAAPAAIAQPAPAPTWSQEDTVRIVNEVQKKLAGLPNYSVFDWITFGVQGRTIILKG